MSVRLYGKDKVRSLIERQRARIERTKAEAESRRAEELRVMAIARDIRARRERDEAERVAEVGRARRQRQHIENWQANFSNVTEFSGASNRPEPAASEGERIWSPTDRPRGAASSAASPGSSAVLGAQRQTQADNALMLPLADPRRIELNLPLFGSTWSQSLELLRRGSEAHLKVLDLGTFSGAGLFTSTPVSQRTLGSASLLGAGGRPSADVKTAHSGDNDGSETDLDSKSELSRFRAVFAPLRRRIECFRQSILRLGFRLLWRHVESERARMFALGESRLNHRKARKHHWFTRVGRVFSVWKRAARQALESRLRIALLLRKKRVSLLHTALIIKWRPYTNALRALLQRKLNRALAYWRNSGMMRAFMGWRAAVARGLALRAALRISQQWRMRHLCGGALRVWHVDAVASRLRAISERRHLVRRLKQWTIFVSDSQTERRFLQRAGRRWRNLLKRRCVRKWRVSTVSRVNLRKLIIRAASRLAKVEALQWALKRWVRVVAAITEADREERLHAKLHSDGLCDCVRARFGPKGGRERMLQWQREEAEEEAWLKKERLRKMRKVSKKGGGGTEENDDDEGRRQRRIEYMRLRKQRKKRREMKKKMHQAKRLREMAVPRGKVRTGASKVPFRCSLQAHLTRRINDAYSLVDNNLSSATSVAANSQLSSTGGGTRTQKRRASTVLRQSHWI
eukprot:g1570.t1